MTFAERLENVILAYEHGGRSAEIVQVELLRLVAEILVDMHEKRPGPVAAR